MQTPGLETETAARAEQCLPPGEERPGLTGQEARPCFHVGALSLQVPVEARVHQGHTSQVWTPAGATVQQRPPMRARQGTGK